MKVLHILGELKPSGAEAMLYAAGPLLKGMDIEAEILSTGAEVGPYTGQLATAGYAIRHICFRKSPLFFWQVFKLIKDNHYDAIHLHTERANFWLGIVILLTGKRGIRTIHNTFPFSGFLGWRRKLQRQLLNRLGLKHITISQSVHDTEYKYYGLDTAIIPNWYNSLRFLFTTPQQRAQAKVDLNIPADSFVLLTIGNCSPVKNHTALIQALALMTPDNWIYLHVGIEKDSIERELAAELGISDKIRFLGLQTDILPFLQSSDLYVMPSTHEGCPISAIEAIAAGLPALMTKVPGLVDFKTIFNGLFYCEQNAEAIAAALTEIILTDSKILHKECAENSKIAEQRFGILRGLANYVAEYKNTAG